MSENTLTVKTVTTAIEWEYKALPPSKLRCALCLSNCSETAEGPSSEPGVVRTHAQCGAVVHVHCLDKYRQTPQGTACPQCHQANADFSGTMDLFEAKS